MAKFLVPLLIAFLIVIAAVVDADTRYVSAPFEPFARSDVSGQVDLTQMSRGGTLVTVKADGLHAGTMYVALFRNNQVCDPEPYDEKNVIGRFTATSVGMTTITRKMTANLDRIGSISIRVLNTGSLEACADVR